MRAIFCMLIKCLLSKGNDDDITRPAVVRPGDLFRPEAVQAQVRAMTIEEFLAPIFKLPAPQHIVSLTPCREHLLLVTDNGDIYRIRDDHEMGFCVDRVAAL